MADDRDPFRALADADPARTAPPFDPRSARGKEVLERARSTTGVTALPRERRGPGRTFLAVTLVVAVSGAAAAAAFVNRREATRTLAVGCYGGPTLRTNIHSVTATEDSAVEQCWRIWRSGKFSPTPTPTRLVPCVLDSGVVGVFPGGPEVCARLGRPLAPVDARTDPVAAGISSRMVEAMGASPCPTERDLRDAATAALAELDLAGWQVVSVGPFGPDKPCASFDLDESARRVLLVPTPRRQPPA